MEVVCFSGGGGPGGGGGGGGSGGAVGGGGAGRGGEAAHRDLRAVPTVTFLSLVRCWFVFIFQSAVFIITSAFSFYYTTEEASGMVHQ